MLRNKKTLVLNTCFVLAALAFMWFFPIRLAQTNPYSAGAFTCRTLYRWIFEPALYGGCSGLFTNYLLYKQYLVIPIGLRVRLRSVAIALLLVYSSIVISQYIGLTGEWPVAVWNAVFKARLCVAPIALICLTIGWQEEPGR